MALHDRLRPPTLETPPTRPGTGLPLTLALAVMAAGFAFAMPRIQKASAELEEPPAVVVLAPSGSPSATPTATPVPEPTEAPEEDADEDEGTKEKPENHGKAVSTAAHCPIKGRAHGELVRSIAKDKDATVAEAEAACSAALAAQESATEEPKSKGRSQDAKLPKPSKPAKAEKPAKPPKH